MRIVQFIFHEISVTIFGNAVRHLRPSMACTVDIGVQCGFLSVNGQQVEEIEIELESF